MNAKLVVDNHIIQAHDFSQISTSVPGCPEWTLSVLHHDEIDLAFQLFTKDPSTFQLDVFALHPWGPRDHAIQGQKYTLYPQQGLGFDLGIPLQNPDTVASTDGDEWYRHELKKPLIDSPFPGATGSQRMAFFDRHSIWSKRAGGVSRIQAEYLNAYAAWQLQRPYQAPTNIGSFRLFMGEPVTFPSEIPPAPDKEPMGLRPYWTHHMTVKTLAATYKLLGSPRALDQMVRCVLHALETQSVYDVAAVNFYGRVARVAWILDAIADIIECLEIAHDPRLAALWKYLESVAYQHCARIRQMWDEDLWIWQPAKTLPYTATSVFHVSVMAHALRRIAEKLTPEVHAIWKTTADWIDAYGWDYEAWPDKLTIYYDATPDQKYQTVANLNGVGQWAYSGLRETHDLGHVLAQWAKDTKYGGTPESEWMRWFGDTLVTP